MDPLNTSVVPVEEYLQSRGAGFSQSVATQFPAKYKLIWTPEVVFRVTTIIVVMAFTFIGNTSLISGIICHRKLRRKRVNIFLINLAVGDLMVCLVTMTTEILFVAFGEWVLGEAACKIIVYGQIVTLASTTFLLTAMSIDRYQVIVQPFKALTGQPKIWRKVLFAWMLALIFAVPQLFIFVQTDEGLGPDGKMIHACRSEGYTAKWQRKFYFTAMTVYILIIPTAIMTFCYVNIIRVVWMRTSSTENRQPKLRFVSNYSKTRSLSSNAESSPEVTSQQPSRPGSDPPNNLTIPPRLVSSSKRNVVKMTLSVIIGFVVCWTPYFSISLVRIYSNYEIGLEHALSVSEIMALVHSALNPILYGIFSTRVLKRACVDFWSRCREKEVVATMDFVVSDEDSSYWTETKLKNMTVKRLPNGQLTATEYRRFSFENLRAFCSKLWSQLCCKLETPSPPSVKPLLIYRKALGKDNAPGLQHQYESFRLRAQTTTAEYARSRDTVMLRGIAMSVRSQTSRSSVHLSIPVNIPTKSISDSNIHKLNSTYTPQYRLTHSSGDEDYPEPNRSAT